MIDPYHARPVQPTPEQLDPFGAGICSECGHRCSGAGDCPHCGLSMDLYTQPPKREQLS